GEGGPRHVYPCLGDCLLDNVKRMAAHEVADRTPGSDCLSGCGGVEPMSGRLPDSGPLRIVQARELNDAGEGRNWRVSAFAICASYQQHVRVSGTTAALADD